MEEWVLVAARATTVLGRAMNLLLRRARGSSRAVIRKHDDDWEILRCATLARDVQL